MGQRKMKCVQCGTENVNKILVTFVAQNEIGEEYSDTTTLAKFLYYLEHPSDMRHKDMSPPYKLIKVKYYSCINCHEDKLIEGKKSNFGLRIPSRRYGI